jgi:hypothetical protein
MKLPVRKVYCFDAICVVKAPCSVQVKFCYLRRGDRFWSLSVCLVKDGTVAVESNIQCDCSDEPDLAGIGAFRTRYVPRALDRKFSAVDLYGIVISLVTSSAIEWGVDNYRKAIIRDKLYDALLIPPSAFLRKTGSASRT